MRDKWLVTLDIDGTILTSGYEVLPEVRDAIQSARRDGVSVALSTARSIRSMRHILDEVGGVDAAICFGGALILHPTDDVPASVETLTARELAPLVHDARSLGVSLALYSLEDAFVDRMNDILDHQFRVTGSRAMERDLTTLDMPIVKGLAISDKVDPSPLHKLQAKYSAEMSVLFSHSNFLEIMRAGVTKGKAVAALREQMGIDPGHVIAIGDSENDLSMFAEAGTAIAMGNATDHVKSKAAWTTLSNERAGVAAALRECRARFWS